MDPRKTTEVDNILEKQKWIMDPRKKQVMWIMDPRKAGDVDYGNRNANTDDANSGSHKILRV